MSRSVCTLLIVVAVGIACGHIVSAQRVYEPALHRDEANTGDRRPLWPKTRPNPLPMYGSNDRSRWATVRALVDDGTFAIGKRDLRTLYASVAAPLGQLDGVQAAMLFDAGYRARVQSDSGIIFEDGWQSVDKVLDPSAMRYYSSKPPLLSLLIAGLYWVVKLLTGWTLTTRPNEVIRTLLLLVNGVPFAVYLWQLARIVERWGATDWGKLYVLAAGAFATLVMPFLITLNNHTIGTFAVMFAWYSILRISQWSEGPPAWVHFVAAGFFSAFAATNELPALAFTAAVFALLLWWHPRRTLLLAVPPALVVAAAFFAANYAVLGTWRVAYAETGSVWYQYEGSHWRTGEGQKKYGIDWVRKNGREGPGMYAVHVLVGHHGWFSLTPIWFIAVAGMAGGLVRIARGRGDQTHMNQAEPLPPSVRTAVAMDPAGARTAREGGDQEAPSRSLPWFVHPLGLALSMVVIGFYLYASDNYGGWTNGLRWLMWLTPIWLTCLLPAADHLAGCRWGRTLAYVLLAVSVLSMSYEPWNPWRHPWIYDLMQELGWEGY
jgi:hypothetical protein